MFANEFPRGKHWIALLGVLTVDPSYLRPILHRAPLRFASTERLKVARHFAIVYLNFRQNIDYLKVLVEYIEIIG